MYTYTLIYKISELKIILYVYLCDLKMNHRLI